MFYYLETDKKGYVFEIHYTPYENAEKVKIHDENHEVFERPKIYQLIKGELVRDNEKAKPRIYFDTDEEDFLQGLSSTPMKKNQKPIIVEEGHKVLNNPFIFKYVDGELIESNEKQEELTIQYEEERLIPKTDEVIELMLGQKPKCKKIPMQVNKLLELLTEKLTDEEAVQVPDLFEEWQPDKNYVLGKRLKYGVDENGVTQLYEVAQSHTSQENWDPKSTHSLYKQIGVTDSGYDIWTQPYGSEDAYNVGDIVFHNKILYISVKDNNVWEPGVYGWKEYE